MNDPLSAADVETVLRRAAQLHGAEEARGSEPAFTAAEVEQAAREAGIDPRFVRAALAERAQPAPPPAGPGLRTAERVVPVVVDDPTGLLAALDRRWEAFARGPHVFLRPGEAVTHADGPVLVRRCAFPSPGDVAYAEVRLHAQEAATHLALRYEQSRHGDGVHALGAGCIGGLPTFLVLWLLASFGVALALGVAVWAAVAVWEGARRPALARRHQQGLDALADALADETRRWARLPPEARRSAVPAADEGPLRITLHLRLTDGPP